jgi:ribosomal protein L28
LSKTIFNKEVGHVGPLSGHRARARLRHRRWDPNIQRKTYYLPSAGRRITLRVSAKGIKTIDRDGIEAVAARLRARGEKF